MNTMNVDNSINKSVYYYYLEHSTIYINVICKSGQIKTINSYNVYVAYLRLNEETCSMQSGWTLFLL